MHRVYLSIGSNMGDRQHFLREAVRLLGENPAVIIEQRSKFYETSPVGGVPQDDFINAAVKLSTTLEPEPLLDLIHEIETGLGRERLIHWGPRTIDIDILYFDDLELTTERLTIPHPELKNRLFVLTPLAEIWQENQELSNLLANFEQAGQEIHEVIEDLPYDQQIETAVQEILTAVGENPEREGLLETPARVAKMYAEILSSQRKVKFDEYKLFKIEPAEEEQTVMVADIPFYSMCEHHMLPFFGKAHVAYIPKDGNIIGLSKIPRLVDYVSRRLSVQENITRDIAETLQEILSPKGVAVFVEARHMCVEMRGVKKLNSNTKTTVFLGEYETDASKRQAFMDAIS